MTRETDPFGSANKQQDVGRRFLGVLLSDGSSEPRGKGGEGFFFPS